MIYIRKMILDCNDLEDIYWVNQEITSTESRCTVFDWTWEIIEPGVNLVKRPIERTMYERLDS